MRAAIAFASALVAIVADAAEGLHPDLIWIAQPDQLTSIELSTGKLRQQIPVADAAWVMTDPANGRIWAGGDARFAVFAADGQPVATVVATGAPVRAGAIDGTRRVALLIAGNTVHRYSADTFEYLGSQGFANNVRALALDEAGATYFVLVEDEVLRVDAQTDTISVIPLPNVGAIGAIAFDPSAGRLWIGARRKLLAIDRSGIPALGPLEHLLGMPVHLAGDGSGGAWIADNHVLAHYTQMGALAAQLEPFDGASGGGKGHDNSSRMRSLLVDPRDAAAWVHHNRHMLRIDAQGSAGLPFTVPGSSSALQAAALHVDMTPPELWITHPEAGSFTNDSTPPVDVAYVDYGSAVATDTLALVIDDLPLAAACEADEDVASCVPLSPLADGHYRLAATVADLAGNRSGTATADFTIDTLAPMLQIESPVDALRTNQPELPVQLSLSEPATLTVNGERVALDATLAYSAVHLLQEGENAFHFRAEDRATNATQATRSVTLDTVPPEIHVAEPSEGLVTSASEVLLAGNLDEPAELTIAGESIATDAALSFHAQLALVEGANAFVLQARDLAGNLAAKTIVVTRDTTPPPAPDTHLIEFDFDFENNVGVYIGLPGAVAAGSTVVAELQDTGLLRQDDPFRFEVVAASDGSFRLELPGDFIFYLYVVDAAGNRSAPIGSGDLQDPPRDGRAVGTLGGELSVDPNGTANYRIPIHVAPGAAGMQPDLALLYSSAAGNGQIGVGWSLSGLSAITRCPQDVAHEGHFRNVMYDGDDRLCLDGQRLLLHAESTAGYMQPGARYVTEIASFQRIRAYGGTKASGVNGFRVEDKAGLIRHYGVFADTPDGRIETDGGDTAMIWLVSRIEDRYGNRIDYEYGYERGEYWPQAIRWYNARNVELGKVVLHYEGRPDKSLGALTNRSIRPMTRRLDRIVTHVNAGGWQPVFSYLLDYEQAQASGLSRLAGIEQCMGNVTTAENAADGVCLPRTGFAYGEGAVNWGDYNYDHRDFGNVYSQRMRTVDLDLDGHLDAVWLAPRPDELFEFHGEWEIKFGGDSHVRRTGILTDLDDNDSSANAAKSMTLFDANGDGYPDLVTVTTVHNRFDVFLWEPDERAFAATPYQSFTALYNAESGGFSPVPIDIDGDGRTELIYKTDRPLSSTHALTIHWFDGRDDAIKVTDWGVRTDQIVRPIEFNGDGLPDLLIDTFDCSTDPNTAVPVEDPDTGGGSGGGGGGGEAEPWHSCAETAGILINRGNGVFDKDAPPLDCVTPPPPPLPCKPSAIDCDDIQPPAEITADPYYFPGMEGGLSCGIMRSTNFRADRPIVTDQNGDGLTDIITYSGSSERFKLWLNSGGVFTLASTRHWGYLAPHEVSASISADVNQDGAPDLLFMDEHDQFLLLMTPHGFGGDGGRFIEGQKDVRYADVDSDGDLDILGHENTWYVRRQPGGRRDLLVGVITGAGERTAISYAPLASRALIDGKPLYQGHLSPAEAEKDLAQHRNLLPPLTVVASFAMDTGTDRMISTFYTYKGLKADRQRGLLGFKEVRARNENTGITTVNVHRQAWPFTGMIERSFQFIPERTVPNLPADDDVLDGMGWPCAMSIRFCDDPFEYAESSPAAFAPETASLNAVVEGRLLSETVNTLDRQESAQGETFPHVVQSTSTDSDYHSGAAYRETQTTYSYDDYGNAQEVIVLVRTPGGGEWLKTTTSNVYEPVSGGNETHWCLGRLSQATVAHQWSGNPAILRRTSSFGYSAPPHCQLDYEKIHAAGAGRQENLVLETFHAHDDYGNVESTRVRGWDGNVIAERVTAFAFDDAAHANDGRFPRAITNSAGHTETRDYDARFGVVARATGPNGLTTLTEHDSFGRPVRAIAPRTNSVTSIVRAWCSNDACLDDLSMYKEISRHSSGGQTITEYDRLGRVVKAAARSFGGGISTQEKRYDLLGREIAVSLPHRESEPVCWAFTSYDNLNRPTLRAAPASSNACSSIPALPTQLQLQQFQASPPAGYAVSKTVHEALRTVTQDASGRNTQREVHVTGWLKSYAELNDGDIAPGQIPTVRSEAGHALATHYAYDATGNTVAVTDPAGNVVSMAYDNRGRKTGMNDPDMGAWSYTYNAFGELVHQRDAKGQGVLMHYDALGRMVRRIEPEGVTTWTYDSAPGKGVGRIAFVEQSGGYREAYSYTSFGEPESTVRVIDGETYWQHNVYDSYGRVQDQYYPALAGEMLDPDNEIDASAWTPAKSAVAVRTLYDDETGVPKKLRALNPVTGVTGTVYWHRLETDSAGRTTAWSLGNGMSETRNYDFARGVLLEQHAWGSSDVTAQLDLRYAWDAVGNLVERSDLVHLADGTLSGFKEWFSYDALHRLDTVSRNVAGHGTAVVMNHRYDAIGNLLSQHEGIDPGVDPGVRGYVYGDSTNAAIRPHAVRSASVRGVARNYGYDANGNLVEATWAGTTRAVAWTSFNKPASIVRGAVSSAWRYGPDRAHYQHTAVTRDAETGAAVTTTTTTLGGYEKIKTGNAITHRYHIAAGGAVVALREIETRADAPTVKRAQRTHYLHRDHLGSIALITDAAGRKLERAGYSAWGQRINLNGLASDSTFKATEGAGYAYTHSAARNFHRGYTGHDTLEHLGLVHMNGRIYDPEIGRFLSADPFVQFPESTQGFNRYTYVNNNPLSYADPSGYFSLRKELGKALGTIAPLLNFIPGCQIWCAVVASAVGGYMVTGSVQAGLMAGAMTAISMGAGVAAQGIDNILLRSVVMGAVGGLLSKASGGRFGDGFLGGMAGTLIGPAAPTGNIVTDMVVGAILGGTVAVIGGGKFKNGAASGAFAAAARNLGTSQTEEGDSEPPGRALTENEISEAQKVYGDNIDYSRVRIVNDKFFFLQGKAWIIAPDGNVYWPDGCADLVTCHDGSYAETFIHEMAHVYQHQNGVNVIGQGFLLHARRILSFGLYDPYQVTYKAGTSFSSYNIEQQAKLAEMIYRGEVPNMITEAN